MKTFTCGYSNLMDYLKQFPEEAVEYIDGLDGSLIDDLFISIPGGYMVCLETYQNAWSSVYTVRFYGNKENKKAWEEWETYKKNYFELYPEEAAKYE